MIYCGNFNPFPLISISHIIEENYINFEIRRNFEKTIKTSKQRIKETKKQRNKETKKQRNKEPQEVLLIKSGRKI